MTTRHHLPAAAITDLPEISFVHPLDANAIRHTRTLSETAGLRNLGVHLVRIEPGHATTEYHLHRAEEEFLYVLAGRGVATIDGRDIEVGPGDFLGFPADGPAHVMRNDGPDDLVYLMAGQRLSSDVVDYPRRGKRLLKVLGHHQMVDLPADDAR